MAPTALKGVIFDLDGVVTGTARVHALAWESMFNVFLRHNAERQNKPYVAFNAEHDYLEYVDGKHIFCQGGPCFHSIREFANLLIELGHGVDVNPKHSKTSGKYR